jgi:protein-L-isoaspartate(D-aspartate) O-methyltransferase
MAGDADIFKYETTRRERELMVKQQIEARGVRDPAVLKAMREVPRELFVEEHQRPFAYADTPLPIPEGQVITQPYLVGLMAQALQLSPTDRVLEVGTGSGYAAAVLSRIAGEVYTIERFPSLAEAAMQRLAELGYNNVHVKLGDGSLGWPEHAPYDAISVAAGGPAVPKALLDQLKIGGRMVIPLGDRHGQSLVRIVRRGPDRYERQDLGPVRFVPLVGEQGWPDDPAPSGRNPGSDRIEPDVRHHTPNPPDPPDPDSPRRRYELLGQVESVAALIAEGAEPIADIEKATLTALLKRIAGCRVVLIGEATHGTSEFYRMRAAITRALIQQQGFNFVAAEADWPDTARVDRYVRHATTPGRAARIFVRFPTWMWRNVEVLDFVEWLREHNMHLPHSRRVGFHGLDLYSLYESVAEVLHYLEQVDPESARIARARYGCLTPFQSDPALYGHAAITGQYKSCEQEVVQMLVDLLRKRLEFESGADEEAGERFFDALQNARVIADAEKYYRAMYYGTAESWNLRDRHMFETLQTLMDRYGPDAKGIVWAHNSHVGDACATEMFERDEINIGHLARQAYGMEAYIIGFGTDHGTVAAASNWGEPVQIMQVRPAHPRSYEHLCHRSGVQAFILSLRQPAVQALDEELRVQRLERAIGVIYRPETELLSHYFEASLPAQFDEYIWFDETHAVTPLGRPHAPRLPDTHPFALLD